MFAVKASGEISLRGADGPKSSPGGTGQTDPANTMPSVPTGALIGRIGTGQPFLIGTASSIAAPAAGQLFLGINDSNVSDNQGSYQVDIQRSAPAADDSSLGFRVHGSGFRVQQVQGSNLEP